MINADVIIILVYLRHRDFERNHGYRLIKVWLFVLTLRLFRSQVQSFSHWLHFVITPILSTVITALSVKSFLITTSFFAVMTAWSHRDHGQTFLATTTKVVSVITPWSHFCDHAVITAWSRANVSHHDYLSFFCDHTVITAWSRVKSFYPWSRIVITPVITPWSRPYFYWGGESFSDHSAVKRMLNFMKNYFRQELL